MEIRIGKPGRVCAKTEKEFTHGEELVSVMRVENQQLVRRDYSKSGWHQTEGSGAVAVWETQYIDPAVAQQEPAEKFSPLRKLFYDSVESSDRIQIAKAYLAAQLLRRQKVFRLVKESDDSEGESRVALFLDRIGNRLVEARDPHLTYDEMKAGRLLLMEELTALESAAQGDESHGEQQ